MEKTLYDTSKYMKSSVEESLGFIKISFKKKFMESSEMRKKTSSFEKENKALNKVLKQVYEKSI